MHLFSRLSTRLLSCCAAGLLLLACVDTTVQAASGNLEIDFVFPQNDTYSPQPIIPVAFAFQNSALAGFVQPRVDFIIIPYGNHTESIASGYFDMKWANFTESDPYMQYGQALEVLNTEGVWELHWTLSVTNCSSTNGGNLEYTPNDMVQRVVFTTKNGAKKPDLTAATSADTCANAQAYAFTITETKDTGDFFDNRKPCAVMAETRPTPNPCAVQIDAAAAGNLSASMTARACAVTNATWCPEPKDDGAHGLMVPSLAVASVAFLAAAVGMGLLAL
ncbi:hypothetical protein V493_01801 [Pseudogymnoascus sp. VKM F-4281 (FW-2241)]|nr:hypothetical protein V493_01801 [Pseudogymnoascus sp. VKM F-4281 (FW-2241)]